MAEPIQLYLDEDAIRASIIRALRARQIDVTTAFEADLISHSDEENLLYAATQNRVLFSFNRGDFVHLHHTFLTTNRHHAGIIVSNQLETGVIVLRLLKLLNTRSAADMQDWLEFLSNWR